MILLHIIHALKHMYMDYSNPLIRVFFFTMLMMYFLCSCLEQRKAVGAKVYFEGEVKFRIESASLNPNIADKVIQDIIGGEMIGIVSENKYKVININQEGDTLVGYYDLLDQKVYYDYENRDTIWWYSLNEAPGELISIQRNEKPQKEIMGKERESVTIRYLSKEAYIDEFEGTYYFHPDYHLNRAAYSSHKENFWNLFVNETGAISIRNEVIARPLYTALYEAYEIKERDVSESEFEMDKNKVIVKGE